MRLEGVVTNVTNFGAFVDVGVHQDGLVHVSQLADRFVKDPHEVVRPGQVVQVRVLEVDVERKRISLSMKAPEAAGGARSAERDAPREPNAGAARDRGKQKGGPRPRRPERGDAPAGAMADALRRALGKGD
jgi:uncharacterized protein